MPLKLSHVLILVVMFSLLCVHGVHLQAQRRPGSGQGVASKPRLAVLPFQQAGVVSEQDIWAVPGVRASRIVQDVFVTELRKLNRFQLVEREQLAALTGAGNSTLWGDYFARAVKIGKQLGAHYVLCGSVAMVGDRNTRPTRGARKGRGAARSSMPGVLIKARLIDTSTGEVVWADEVREASRSKVSVGGFGGGIDDDRMLKRAIQPLVQKLVAGIRSAKL